MRKAASIGPRPPQGGLGGHQGCHSVSQPKPLQLTPFPIVTFRVGEPPDCCSAEVEITNVNRAERMTLKVRRSTEIGNWHPKNHPNFGRLRTTKM
jgi:hypothetical protein